MRDSSANKIFSDIYASNLWVFGSGAGSLPEATLEYRTFLQRFLADNAITSVVDFGCGDWQSSSLMDWSHTRYHGIDVVPNLVATNNERFGIPGQIQFSCASDHLLDLPDADLLIVKDVLQHWPNARVQHFLEVALPRFKRALITNCCWPRENINQDIPLGGWRPLDLSRAPFWRSGAVVHRFEGVAPEPVSSRWEKVTFLIIR